MNNFAIACMSGSLKGVFIQGVLTAFEEANIKADAYAGCSSSTLPASYAAIGELNNIDQSFWENDEEILKQPGNSMSNVVLSGIDRYSDKVIEKLNSSSSSRLMIVCSFVNTTEAAKQTQGDQAVTLGRKLVIQGARKITGWKDKNLELQVFDTDSCNEELKITPANYKEVAYATTRMLHAWHIPATINGKSFIDGSYTCLIPVEQLAERGYKNIIAIATETGEIAKDFFSSETIGNNVKDSIVHWIKPEVNLKELGVDYTKASKEGIKKVFRYGLEKGNGFIDNNFNITP